MMPAQAMEQAKALREAGDWAGSAAVLAPVPFLWRTWLFSMGYWHIKVRGTPAPRAAAP